MTRDELLKIRNEKIYARYKELYDIKFLRHCKVLDILSEEFYLGIVSLEKIVLQSKKSNKEVTT